MNWIYILHKAFTTQCILIYLQSGPFAMIPISGGKQMSDSLSLINISYANNVHLILRTINVLSICSTIVFMLDIRKCGKEHELKCKQ